jgi:hypothetical protein
MDRQLEEKHSRINVANDNLQALRQQGAIREYNSQVSSYNLLVAEYNR